jgi:hypothetical protein
MDRQCVWVLVITAVMYFMIADAYANDTVTILEPDGTIQICKVTESGVIVCL